MTYDDIDAGEQEDVPQDDVKKHSAKSLKKSFDVKSGKKSSAKGGGNPFAKKLEKKSGKKVSGK